MISLLRATLLVATSLFAFHAAATPLATPWGVEFEACDVLPTKADVDKAKSDYRKGQTAFNEGAYSESIDLWLAAYRLDCHAHALLLNLATAFELNGRVEDAVRALRYYNEREPQSEYVEPNQKRIERLEDQLLEEQKRAIGPPPPVIEPKAASPAPTTCPAQAAPPSPVALALDTAGAAMVLAGGALFVEGRLSAANAASSCESRASCDDFRSVVLGERARARATAGGWLMLAGALVGATGLGWHWLGDSGREPTESARGSLSTSLSPRAASIHWRRAF